MHALARSLIADPRGAASSSAPQGVTMGHAGALVQGNGGTAQSKMEALQQAGATVFSSIRELVEGVVRAVPVSAGCRVRHSRQPMNATAPRL
jgi:hypothetical protein